MLSFFCAFSIAQNRYLANAAEKFRFAVISDTHIKDKHYVCCETGGPKSPDTVSLKDSEAKLKQAVAGLNALTPAIDMVLITGDLVHNYDIPLKQMAVEHIHMDIAKDILNGLKAPWYAAMGNHDHNFQFPQEELFSLWVNKMGKEHVGQDAYLAIDHKGFRFILINQYRCGKSSIKGFKRTACLGKKQFQWLKEQFDTPMPLLLFAHQPPMDYDYTQEVFDGETLITLIRKKKNVAAFFQGHNHQYMNGALVSVGGAPGYAVSATRFNPKARFIVEADPATGKVKILNTDEFRWGTR